MMHRLQHMAAGLPRVSQSPVLWARFHGAPRRAGPRSPAAAVPGHEFAQRPPREQLDYVLQNRAAVEHGIAAENRSATALEAAALEIFAQYEEMLAEEMDSSRQDSGEQATSNVLSETDSAAILSSRKPLRDRMETVPASEATATALRSAGLIGTGSLEDEGPSGPLQLTGWQSGSHAGVPLRVDYPGYAIFERQAAHGIPKQEDLAHAIMVAFLLDRMPAIPAAYPGRGGFNPLMFWAGGFASELGVDDWYQASASTLVLTGPRRSVIAIVDTDSVSTEAAEPRLYSTYMRAWWPDPNDPPPQIGTNMATLMLSLQGTQLRVYGCTWLHQPYIEELASVSIPLSKALDDTWLMAAARCIHAFAEAIKLLQVFQHLDEVGKTLVHKGIISQDEYVPWMLRDDDRFEQISPLPLNGAKSDGRKDYYAYRVLFEGKPAVVKLLRGNIDSVLVHQKWAEHGLAPELLASEPAKYHCAETGLHMLVVQDLQQTPGWTQLSMMDVKHRISLREPLQRALKRGHQLKVSTGSKSLHTVHGDPRACNIFLHESAITGRTSPAGSIYFINFDSAGQDGVITFPAGFDVGPTDLKELYSTKFSDWPDGVGPGQPITRALDLAVLEKGLRAEPVKAEDNDEVLPSCTLQAHAWITLSVTARLEPAWPLLKIASAWPVLQNLTAVILRTVRILRSPTSAICGAYTTLLARRGSNGVRTRTTWPMRPAAVCELYHLTVACVVRDPSPRPFRWIQWMSALSIDAKQWETLHCRASDAAALSAASASAPASAASASASAASELPSAQQPAASQLAASQPRGDAGLQQR